MEQLEAEFDKLVRYVRVYGEYAKAWIRVYEEDEEDDPDFAPVQETGEALSDETRARIEVSIVEESTEKGN